MKKPSFACIYTGHQTQDFFKNHPFFPVSDTFFYYFFVLRRIKVKYRRPKNFILVSKFLCVCFIQPIRRRLIPKVLIFLYCFLSAFLWKVLHPITMLHMGNILLKCGGKLESQASSTLPSSTTLCSDLWASISTGRLFTFIIT